MNEIPCVSELEKCLSYLLAAFLDCLWNPDLQSGQRLALCMVSALHVGLLSCPDVPSGGRCLRSCSTEQHIPGGYSPSSLQVLWVRREQIWEKGWSKSMEKADIASIPKILGRNFVRIFFFLNWDSLCFLFQHIFNYCCDYLMSSINDSPKQWFPVTADAQQCILVTVVQTISGEKILSRQQPWINSSPYNILCVRS